MKDNYLWDRTGEPEADVQEFEEILGTLRHRPRTLEIPAGIHPRRRSFVPAIAIAAAVLLLLLAAGLWRVIHRANGTGEAKNDVNQKLVPSPLPPAKSPDATVPKPEQENAGTHN